MLIKPERVPEDVDGLITRLEVNLPEELVTQADALFSDRDCLPVEIAVCYGATSVLMKNALEQAPFDDLMDVMSGYFSAVASLHFRTWSLLQTRQVLGFHLSAARAENRLRVRLRQEKAEKEASDT